MEKNQKQEYESPEFRLLNISPTSIVMGSWGDGSISDNDDDENYVYDF